MSSSSVRRFVSCSRRGSARIRISHNALEQFVAGTLSICVGSATFSERIPYVGILFENESVTRVNVSDGQWCGRR